MEINGPANKDVKIKIRIESACKIPLLDVKNKPTVIGNRLKIMKASYRKVQPKVFNARKNSESEIAMISLQILLPKEKTTKITNTAPTQEQIAQILFLELIFARQI